MPDRATYRVTELRYGIKDEGEIEWLVYLKRGGAEYVLRLTQPHTMPPPPYHRGQKVQLDSRLLDVP